MILLGQFSSWIGKENQAPIRMDSVIRDLALLLDGDGLPLNDQGDLLKFRAGKLKCDRLATGGFWGAYVSTSDDVLHIVESVRKAWIFMPVSMITPPQAYSREKRYRHYSLSVGDAIKLRADKEYYLWRRLPHEGAFGSALEVCDLLLNNSWTLNVYDVLGLDRNKRRNIRPGD